MAPPSGSQAIVQDLAVVSDLKLISSLWVKGTCSNIKHFGALFEGIKIADEVEVICGMVNLAIL